MNLGREIIADEKAREAANRAADKIIVAIRKQQLDAYRNGGK